MPDAVADTLLPVHEHATPERSAADRASPRADAAAATVEAARDGDRAAMGALYERYAPLIHAVLLTRVDAGDAEDLTHDVFVTAMGRLGEVRDASAVGAWLMAVARSRAVDHHRLRARRARLGFVRLARRRECPEVAAVAAEALAHIRALPEAYRVTMMLRLVEGLTGPEIAARTGMTHGSVRVNLHRGMALLRRRMNAEDTT